MSDPKRESVVLGGGCFWCVEAVFSEVQGVTSAVSGYMGGARPNPTYQQVCSGATGHVEVVQVTFEPEVISLHDILEIFFTTHDPTTLDRQGNDVGTQYRSVVFCSNEQQKAVAAEVIREMSAGEVFDSAIVTALEPASTFFPAENYHQNYFANNPAQPYCAFVVSPKVQKLRKKFASRLKSA